MTRGSTYEQSLSDDALLESYENVLGLLAECSDLAYMKCIRDHTRELICRDLLAFSIMDDPNF